MGFLIFTCIEEYSPSSIFWSTDVHRSTDFFSVDPRWIHRKFLKQVFFCGSTDFSPQVFFCYLKRQDVRLRFCVKLNWRPTLSIRILVHNLGIFGQTFFSTLCKSCLVLNEINFGGPIPMWPALDRILLVHFFINPHNS